MNESALTSKKMRGIGQPPAKKDDEAVWEYLTTTQVTPAMATTNPKAFIEYLTNVRKALTLFDERIIDTTAKIRRIARFVRANGLKL